MASIKYTEGSFPCSSLPSPNNRAIITSSKKGQGPSASHRVRQYKLLLMHTGPITISDSIENCKMTNQMAFLRSHTSTIEYLLKLVDIKQTDKFCKKFIFIICKKKFIFIICKCIANFNMIVSGRQVRTGLTNQHHYSQGYTT